MSRVIESFNAITTKWLEEVLGAPAGTISSFTITSSWETPVTQVALVYISTEVTDPKVPRSVFIKISKREQNKELQRMCGREVPFIFQIACLMESANIPRCYSRKRTRNQEDSTSCWKTYLRHIFKPNILCLRLLDPARWRLIALRKYILRGGTRKRAGSCFGKVSGKEGIIELTTYFRRTWAVFSAFMKIDYRRREGGPSRRTTISSADFRGFWSAII